MNAVTLGLIQHRVVYSVTDTSWKLRNAHTYVYIMIYMGPGNTSGGIIGRMLIRSGVISAGIVGAP